MVNLIGSQFVKRNFSFLMQAVQRSPRPLWQSQDRKPIFYHYQHHLRTQPFYKPVERRINSPEVFEHAGRAADS